MEDEKITIVNSEELADWYEKIKAENSSENPFVETLKSLNEEYCQ